MERRIEIQPSSQSDTGSRVHSHDEVSPKTEPVSDSEIEIVEELEEPTLPNPAERKPQAQKQEIGPRTELPRILEAAHDDVDWIHERLRSDKKPLRDELTNLKNDIEKRRDQLNTLLQEAFQGMAAEDASHRRDIQDAITHLDETHELLKQWLSEEAVTLKKENPYLSRGEEDQLNRLRAWSGSPHTTEKHKQHTEDRFRPRLEALQKKAPQNKSDEEHRQKAIRTIQEALQRLNPDNNANVVQIKTLNADIEAARQQVIKKYGKPPEALSLEEAEEATFADQIRKVTSNAAAALMGNKEPSQSEDPFQVWMDLMEEKAALQPNTKTEVPSVKSVQAKLAPRRKKAA